MLNALAPVLPELWGGSADLAGSNDTTMKGEPSFVPEIHQTKMFPGNRYGRTLHFGIREHGMGAILNGIALHGLTRPYGGTFLVFSDYMRPVGAAGRADGPAGHLRVDARLHRPRRRRPDAPAGRAPVGAARHPRPRRRQARRRQRDHGRLADDPGTHRSSGWPGPQPAEPAGVRSVGGGAGLASAEGTARGGYVLADAEGAQPDVILIGTGSEVQLALAASKLLAADGIKARVVSMPCVEWFSEQDAAYRDQVLPPHIQARVSVEAGIALGWRQFVGDAGRSVSLEHFGASADY